MNLFSALSPQALPSHALPTCCSCVSNLLPLTLARMASTSGLARILAGFKSPAWAEVCFDLLASGPLGWTLCGTLWLCSCPTHSLAMSWPHLRVPTSAFLTILGPYPLIMCPSPSIEHTSIQQVFAAFLREPHNPTAVEHLPSGA